MIQHNLLALAATRSRETLEIEAETAGDPAPYTQTLGKLRLRLGDGPTNLRLATGTTLEIEGSAENLERLASFFDFNPAAADGLHQHYEYYEGNDYIAPEALPLVVHLQ